MITCVYTCIGYQVEFGGQKHSSQGFVALALADNPASQTLRNYNCL